MNSHDGAVCRGPAGGVKGLLPGGNAMLGRNCGALVGGMSGDEALVVPDQNEGTGEQDAGVLEGSSHSVMAIEGMLPVVPAEKFPRSISASGLKGEANWVSTVSGGGLCPQSKLEVGVAMRL